MNLPVSLTEDLSTYPTPSLAKFLGYRLLPDGDGTAVRRGMGCPERPLDPGSPPGHPQNSALHESVDLDTSGGPPVTWSGRGDVLDSGKPRPRRRLNHGGVGSVIVIVHLFHPPVHPSTFPSVAFPTCYWFVDSLTDFRVLVLDPTTGVDQWTLRESLKNYPFS